LIFLKFSVQLSIELVPDDCQHGAATGDESRLNLVPAVCLHQVRIVRGGLLCAATTAANRETENRDSTGAALDFLNGTFEGILDGASELDPEFDTGCAEKLGRLNSVLGKIDLADGVRICVAELLNIPVVRVSIDAID
jgi:hypothetical protein